MQVAFKGKEMVLVSCAQIIFSNLRHCVKSSLCVRMDGVRLGTLGSYDRSVRIQPRETQTLACPMYVEFYSISEDSVEKRKLMWKLV